MLLVFSRALAASITLCGSSSSEGSTVPKRTVSFRARSRLMSRQDTIIIATATATSSQAHQGDARRPGVWVDCLGSCLFDSCAEVCDWSSFVGARAVACEGRADAAIGGGSAADGSLAAMLRSGEASWDLVPLAGLTVSLLGNGTTLVATTVSLPPTAAELTSASASELKMVSSSVACTFGFLKISAMKPTIVQSSIKHDTIVLGADPTLATCSFQLAGSHGATCPVFSRFVLPGVWSRPSTSSGLIPLDIAIAAATLRPTMALWIAEMSLGFMFLTSTSA